MCGACGTGRVAAPWEDVLAGAGPAQRAARAAAAGRLLSARRLRVSPWRGGYLLATATGAARPVASLDELCAVAGPPARSAVGASRWTRAPLPAGWDLQAATVWVAAAARAGTVTAVELPVATGGQPGTGGEVRFEDDGTAYVEHRPGMEDVGVLGLSSGPALADLLRFAGRG